MSTSYSSLPFLLTASLAAPIVPFSTAFAQNAITPDGTLGAESSQVVPLNATTDSIEGGAIRDANLFHSFQDFNVGEGFQVYFNNPTGVDNIFGRVTGGNLSTIFGTLGVEGAANLFFINPNGIVFGPNATLNVEGSFLATTAAGIRFSEGDTFNTSNAASESVLSVGVPLGLQYGSNAASITNTGALTAGQDLTLAAGNLDLQGQLQSGESLTLQATDTLKIRDTQDQSFVAAAGEQLLVQGAESVDIFALNNSESGLFSGGDMTLRSANPVGGDAHYWSGGSFRSENLDGSIGDLFSPYDPIIRSAGDVDIDEYEGTSLHILSGGSVAIGTATITGVEQGAVGTDFLQETITLSDGTLVEIDGSARPTLDVRAGVDPAALGTPPIAVLTGASDTDTFSNNGPETFDAVNADITIGDAVIEAQPGEASNGLVLLTNQYRPRSENTAGDILINGEGDYELGIDVSNEFGDSRGDIFIDSRNNVFVISSDLATAAAGDAGDITVLAQETVRFDSLSSNGDLFPSVAVSGVINIEGVENSALEDTLSTLSSLSEIERLEVLEDVIDLLDSVDVIEGSAGNIRISAANLELLNGASLNADTVYGTGDAGNITIDVTETVRFEGIGINPENNQSLASFISATSIKGGSSGNVSITANNLEILDGASILTFDTLSDDTAGSITLDVEDSIVLNGSSIRRNSGQSVLSGIFSGTIEGAEAPSGNIDISARDLTVTNGYQLNTLNVLGRGNGGNVTIDVLDAVRFDGAESGVSTTVRFGEGAASGAIDISANTLDITNGALLISGTEFSSGNAGEITIDVAETVRLNGVSDENLFEFPVGGILSGTVLGDEGTGGTIQLSARNLEVLNGSQINSSTTLATGDAGDIFIVVEDAILLRGTTVEDVITFGDIIVEPGDFFPTGIASSITAIEGAEGSGGDIFIRAGNLDVVDGGFLRASSSGEAGDAGNIALEIQDQLTASDGTIETAGINTSGGQINITAKDVSLAGDSDILTIVGFGEGGGGNILITADSVNAFGDSDILAFAQDGRGGDVTLNTPAFFGENYKPAPAGTDPLTLDGNGRVDVNADGAIAGIIDVPDVSFIQDNLTELPDNIVNTNQLIAGSCIARRGESGSFVVSGGGGLPDRPGSSAIAPYPIGEIRRLQVDVAQTNLTEPQGIFQLADGRLVMSQSCER